MFLGRESSDVPATLTPQLVCAATTLELVLSWASGNLVGPVVAEGVIVAEPGEQTIVKAKSVASILFLVACWALFGYGIPRTVFVLDWLFCVGLLVGTRYLSRARYEHRSPRVGDGPIPGKKRAVIVGAGDGAEALIQEIRRSTHLNYEVVGLVDDSPRVQRRSIHGVEIAGTVDDLPRVCNERRAEEILIAIPSASASERGRVLERCRMCALPVKTVPALGELFEGKARLDQLQEVKPEDILGRQPVKIDNDAVGIEIAGKRVLVTGAGGSIGSELCQQLATFGPDLIVLYERGESALHFTQVELAKRCTRPANAPVPRP